VTDWQWPQIGPIEQRMDTEDIGALGEILSAMSDFIAEQDEPGDPEGAVATMTEAMGLVASLMPGEEEEIEPPEPSEGGPED
jgi:hypothetical protein